MFGGGGVSMHQTQITLKKRKKTKYIYTDSGGWGGRGDISHLGGIYPLTLSLITAGV